MIRLLFILLCRVVCDVGVAESSASYAISMYAKKVYAKISLRNVTLTPALYYANNTSWKNYSNHLLKNRWTSENYNSKFPSPVPSKSNMWIWKFLRWFCQELWKKKKSNLGGCIENWRVKLLLQTFKQLYSFLWILSHTFQKLNRNCLDAEGLVRYFDRGLFFSS